MKIENKVIPEGINATDEHPLKEFALLTFGVGGAFIAIVVAVCLFAEILAPYVPFSWEQKIASQYDQRMAQATSGKNSGVAHRQLIAYLQQLADRIAKSQTLPAGMKIKVHYIDSGTVNAFATLGGNIFVFRGLLEKLHDENALAWVMGHEIAHIKNRDPIKSLGRGAIIGLVMSVAGVAAGDDMVGNALGQGGLLTILKFSRDQEEQADIESLYSLHSIYGHVGSASEFLQVAWKLQQKRHDNAFEIFENHPLTEHRLRKLAEVARSQGWATDGKPSPLPRQFSSWIACTCTASEQH